MICADGDCPVCRLHNPHTSALLQLWQRKQTLHVCCSVLSPWPGDNRQSPTLYIYFELELESRHPAGVTYLDCGKSGRTGWRGNGMNEQTNSQKDLRAGRWSCLSITQPGCDVTIHLKSFEIDFATGSFFLPNEKNRKKNNNITQFFVRYCYSDSREKTDECKNCCLVA